MDYKEKLEDPRWQKKRLSILNRDNYACKLCGNSKIRLDVHHHCYEKGKAPWEYSDDVLDTYCKKCHKLVEHIKKHTNELSVVKCFYRLAEYNEIVFVIYLNKSTPLLAIYYYHPNGEIEFALNVPSKVLRVFSSLNNILHKNG